MVKELRQLREAEAPARRAPLFTAWSSSKPSNGIHAATGPPVLNGRSNLSERLLPAAATTTVAELYQDLSVMLQDGTGRQGAIRSVVVEKYCIIQMGATGGYSHANNSVS